MIKVMQLTQATPPLARRQTPKRLRLLYPQIVKRHTHNCTNRRRIVTRGSTYVYSTFTCSRHLLIFSLNARTTSHTVACTHSPLLILTL